MSNFGVSYLLTHEIGDSRCGSERPVISRRRRDASSPGFRDNHGSALGGMLLGTSPAARSAADDRFIASDYSRLMVRLRALDKESTTGQRSALVHPRVDCLQIADLRPASRLLVV